MAYKLSLWGVLGSLVLSGCGHSTSDNKAGDVNGPTSAEEVPAAFAKAVCAAASRCCSEQNFDLDATTCEQDLNRDLSREIHEYGTRVEFVPTAAAACVAAYANSICPEKPVEPAIKRVCSDMFRGRQQAGDACNSDDECFEDATHPAYCETGVCQAAQPAVRPQLDQPCGGTCFADATEPQICESLPSSADDLPVSDSSQPLCNSLDGLHCWSEAGKPSTCQALRHIGEGCAGNSASCALNAVCNPQTQRCEAAEPSSSDVAPLAEAGQSCGAGADCASGYCSSTGVCRARLSADSCANPSLN